MSQNSISSLCSSLRWSYACSLLVSLRKDFAPAFRNENIRECMMSSLGEAVEHQNSFGTWCAVDVLSSRSASTRLR